jgi:hypothetical protein
MDSSPAPVKKADPWPYLGDGSLERTAPACPRGISMHHGGYVISVVGGVFGIARDRRRERTLVAGAAGAPCELSVRRLCVELRDRHEPANGGA